MSTKKEIPKDLTMMVYPEDPFWALPTIPGLYDENDYRGKIRVQYESGIFFNFTRHD